MTKLGGRILYLAPRVLGILTAIFISVFALDVFGEGYSFWKAIGAFMIHLVPTYLVVVALIVAWKWEWVGAVLFIGLGVFYVVWVWGRFPLVTYLTISGPLIVTGVLFLLNRVFREQLRSKQAVA